MLIVFGFLHTHIERNYFYNCFFNKKNFESIKLNMYARSFDINALQENDSSYPEFSSL